MAKRGRPSREELAQRAAAQASEAGRILQAQRGHDPEPSMDPPASQNDFDEDRPLPPPRNDARSQAEEEMWAKAEARRNGDVIQASEQVPENLPPPTPEQMLQGGAHSQPEPEPEAKPAAEVPAGEETPPETIEYVRVKVDGEEFDAPKADVDDAGGIKAYQRDKAAERRLAKANETLAEAKRLHAQMAQAVRPPPEPQVTDDEFIAARMDAVRYGTPQEAAQAMREIQQRGAQPALDENIIISKAMTRMNYMNGVKQFNNEFKDLVQDPDLFMIIQAKARAGMEQLPTDQAAVDWTEFYRKIGNEVRIKFGRQSQPQPNPAGQTTGNPSQVSPDREARKASIVNLPTAASRAQVPKESKPETREDILNEMRKSRGLPTG